MHGTAQGILTLTIRLRWIKPPCILQHPSGPRGESGRQGARVAAFGRFIINVQSTAPLGGSKKPNENR
jgi:hypothetical protein